MATGSNGRELLDDEGNVFGVINVVDALVVLLVVVVGVAGAMLLVTENQQVDTVTENATGHVTLDLGPQPTYLAAAVSEGDSVSPTQGSNLTVTAVHLAPAGSQTRVVVGARIRAPASDGRLEYGGNPLWLGRQLEINTSLYNATGRISDIGSEPTLDPNTTTVVVRDRLPPADADAIAAGDEVTVGGRTVATVSDIVVTPTVDGRAETVRVEAELATYTQRDSPHFGETAVTAGRNLTLSGSTYAIDGRIERVGTGLGPLTNRTVRLRATRVSEDIAAVVRPGLTERSGSRTTAYLTGVDRSPSPVVATTANGTIVTGDHPTRSDLTLTTELRVSETATGPQFRGERLQHGSTVVLDLGTVTVETTVVGLAA